MAKVKVVPATEEHLNQLKGRMRAADQEECRAAVDMGADEALEFSFSVSRRTWVALVEDKPILVFGVAAWSAFSEKGYPWLLATEDINDHKIEVAVLSRPYVEEMAKGFEILENFVDTRNEVSKKWLKWCGFNIEDAEPHGAYNLPFHRFWLAKESDKCVHLQ